MTLRGNFIRLALPAAALVMGGIGYHHVFSWSRPLPPLEPPSPPAVASADAVVAATGMVEARSENIEIGAALAGVVLEVYVSADQVGRIVAATTPLFRVDDRHLRAQLGVAQSQLHAAEARLARLEQLPRREELPPSEARVAAAQAQVRLAQDTLDRARRLVEVRSIADEEVVAREEQLQIAAQRLAECEADHRLLLAGAWQPELVVARSEVAAARAEVERLETEIERAIVRSPVDAQVLAVDVRPGQYVDAKGMQPLLVLGDTSVLHVRVDVDEHDIARLALDAPGEAAPRGAPGQRYALHFVRVEPLVVPKRWLTGENTERIDTRVLQLIYAVEPQEPARAAAFSAERIAAVAPSSGAEGEVAAPQGLYVGQQLDVFLPASAIVPPRADMRPMAQSRSTSETERAVDAEPRASHNAAQSQRWRAGRG